MAPQNSYINRILVTPQIATDLLATQTRNRPLSDAQVSAFAEIMRAGRWSDSNDLICVTAGGVLINGQHRLSAVVKSGVSVWMDVKFNADPASVCDRGRPRTSVQSIYMRNSVPDDLANKGVVCLASRVILSTTQNGHRKLTDFEIEDFINRNADLLRKTLDICEHRRSSSSSVTRRAPVRAAVFTALSCGVDADVLFRFSEVANTGFQTGSGQNAAIILRNYALANPASGVKSAELLQAVAELAIRDFSAGVPRRKTYAKPRPCFAEIMRKAVAS